MTIQELLQQIKNDYTEKKRIALLTDFDYTISLPQSDPRACIMDVTCQEALKKLLHAGIHVGIISARTAAKIREINSAIINISIVGSSGWETYKIDDHGNIFAHIHPDFYKIRKQLTELLQTVRKNLYAFADSNPVLPQGTFESVLSTKDGDIIIERNGVHADFPEGIIHTYNLNNIDPSIRTEYVKNISNSYQNTMQRVMISLDQTVLTTFVKMTSLHISNKPNQEGKLSVHISPHIAHGKSNAIKQYFYEPSSPERDLLFKGIPGGFDTIIYSGDSNEDGFAFATGKEKAKVSPKGQKFYSIWVKPDTPQPIAESNADISFDNVAKYGSFLNSLAELLM